MSSPVLAAPPEFTVPPVPLLPASALEPPLLLGWSLFPLHAENNPTDKTTKKRESFILLPAITSQVNHY